MKKKMLKTLGAVGLIATFANAGQLTVANTDLLLTGGVSGGYFYSNNNPTGTKNDTFAVSNFRLILSHKATNPGEMGVTAVFGYTLWPSLLVGGNNTAREDGNFVVIAGWATYKATTDLSLDAGYIVSNIGKEVLATYANPNIHMGYVWYGEPHKYNGARLNYDLDSFGLKNTKIYAEILKDDRKAVAINFISPQGYGKNGYSIGIIGNVMGIDYKLAYLDQTAYKNLINFVLEKKTNFVDLALNIDYQWLDKTIKDTINKGKDDSATGIALYVTPKFTKEFSVPIRVEYINDGTSGIYGRFVNEGNYRNYLNGNDGPKTAWTFTVTPTYKPTKNTYLRAEVGYVSTDKKVFLDKNNQKDNKTVAGVELGFLF